MNLVRLFNGEPRDSEGESIPADWKPRGLNPQPHRDRIAQAISDSITKDQNS